MSTYLPTFVKQLDGSTFAGSNCNCAVAAMALDRETLGRDTTTGKRVRQLTGDTSGGTTQRQVVDALMRGWDADLDLSLNIKTADALKRLDSGQGMMLAGQSSATRGTKWQASETFGDNHQWWCNERRKNSQVAGGYQWLIMDPLGDGRRPGIADFSEGLWLPQEVVLSFARRLNVSATPDKTYVPIGVGKFYAVFTHDTEPHLVLRKGALEISPSRVMVVKVPKGQQANVRSGPSTAHKIINRAPNGSRFRACQRIKGTVLGGDATWFGNIDNTRWLHASSF
jgi:hypothetical protein